MDERTTELNRISELLKNAFDNRYRNAPLNNHQKPVSVVSNRNFASKQFEFAKVEKMPISQTRVPKPTDLDLYWSESTIDLIKRLVKEREQYKQSSELVNAQLNANSSDSAKDDEIVKLKRDLFAFEVTKQMNVEMDKKQRELSIENKTLKDENKTLKDENDKLIAELQKFKNLNEDLSKCNEDLGKCNKNLNDMKIQIFDCNLEKQNANEEADEAAEWTQKEIEKNTSLTQQLQNAENKFKFEKAQMDIMFGMKMDLMKKQFENINNSSNANLLKQIVDLNEQIADLNQQIVNFTTEKQTHIQSIENLNETIRNIKEENKKLTEANKPIIAQSNPDKAKLEQLQTRVINLTQELLIMKMNADLQRQNNANYKYDPQTYEEAEESDMFDVLIEKGKLDLTGGAPKQRLSMKGGARKLYDDATQVVFKKETADKLREQMTEYQNRFKLLKDENDALKKSSLSSVATTDSDAMKILAAKLIALQILYKESQNNLTNEKIANAANQGIALKLQANLTNPASPASLTNASAIADLTKENNNLKKENADIKTTKDALETENVGLKLEKATLESDKATLEIDKTNLTNANTKLEGEKTTLTNAKATLETEKADLTTRLNSTSIASGMSTAISKASTSLPRNTKVFISEDGRVMFSEHK
jgi:hypothetical protein